MNDRVVDVLIIVATVLASAGAGALAGGLIVWRVWEATLARAGQIRPAGAEQPGAVHSRAPVNTEESARRSIAAASLERGALDIQERYRANGRNISLKEARAEAAIMLSSEGTLGGVT